MSSGLVQTMYGADSDDNTKMKPSGKAFQYQEAVQLAKDTVAAGNDRPVYVIINKADASNAYQFKYEADGGYIDAGKFTAVPIRLDIQPIAWNKAGGSVGDVTFVYKRSSSGN